MSLDNENIKLIEKFLNGELSAEDQAILAERMKNNDFAKEFHFQKDALHTFRLFHDKKLKTYLNDHFPEEVKNLAQPTKDNNKKQFLIAPILLVAATIALFIIAYLWISGRHQTETSDFTAFYKVYPAQPITREPQSVANQVLTKYKEGNYAEAASAAEKLIKTNLSETKKTELLLILGNCYLNINELQKAANVFKQVKTSSDKILSQHGAWYYALTLLRQNNIEQCIKALDEIILSESFYKQEATVLYNQLQD